MYCRRHNSFKWDKWKHYGWTYGWTRSQSPPLTPHRSGLRAEATLLVVRRKGSLCWFSKKRVPSPPSKHYRPIYQTTRDWSLSSPWLFRQEDNSQTRRLNIALRLYPLFRDCAQPYNSSSCTWELGLGFQDTHTQVVCLFVAVLVWVFSLMSVKTGGVACIYTSTKPGCVSLYHGDYINTP